MLSWNFSDYLKLKSLALQTPRKEHSTRICHHKIKFENLLQPKKEHVLFLSMKPRSWAWTAEATHLQMLQSTYAHSHTHSPNLLCSEKSDVLVLFYCLVYPWVSLIFHVCMPLLSHDAFVCVCVCLCSCMCFSVSVCKVAVATGPTVYAQSFRAPEQKCSITVFTFSHTIQNKCPHWEK